MGNRIFEKLKDAEALHRSPILILAADAGCGVGLNGLGYGDPSTRRCRTHSEFLQLIRDIAADDIVDGILMSPSDAPQLAGEEKLFENVGVTPAVRLNSETATWGPRHSVYKEFPSRPFTIVSFDMIEEFVKECAIRIGLYSITLNNHVASDELTLSTFLIFAEKMRKLEGFDYMLEVFLPNSPEFSMNRDAKGEFVADSIARILNYLTPKQRPLIIKTDYTTPKIWESLTRLDPTVVIGAMGGARQSTADTFRLAHESVKHGGRAILFGRAIFEEENPVAMTRCLRKVLDGQLEVESAVEEYNGYLAQGGPA